MSYLKKYEYVIAVSKYRSISRAAESFGISQSTFSKYLKKLECEIGVELFDRSSIPLKLTKAGEEYVNAGKKFLDLDKQLNKELQEVISCGGATLNIGISPSRSPYIMPAIIEQFTSRRKNTKIVIQERTTKELNRLLSEGELDVVISLLDEETEGFERVELKRESILLAVPKSFAQTTSALDVLKSVPLINVGKGQFMFQIMQKLVQKFDLPEPRIECQSIESALSLVNRGLGAMLVPSYISSNKNQNVRFLEIEECEYERKVCVFYRKEQFLTQAEKDFIACVKEVIKEE